MTPAISPELLAFARVPDRYSLVSDEIERYADERVCLVQGTVWAGVCGVRARADEVEELLADVRARVPAEKHLVWWIDPDATPSDLRERLLALGLREPRDGGAVVHSLACLTEPGSGTADVDVRRVATFDEHVTAVQLGWEAFDIPTERREQQRPHLRTEFEAAQRAGVPVTFLARVGEEPAGIARSVYSDRGVFLIAGSVLERFRGRGVYRALVRARWDDAVRRGTPALVTEALPDTSYPILLRLGFVDVGTTRRLEDPRDDSPVPRSRT